MNVPDIAVLANLTLTSQEIETLTPQFDATLKVIAVIDELDTSHVQPTAQVTGLTNVFRLDEIDTSRILPVDVAISQAQKSQNGYFIVPAVIESQ